MKQKFIFITLFLFILIVLLFWYLYAPGVSKEEMRYCDDVKDCTFVKCRPTCSGCGPDFEDIINKRYINAWKIREGCFLSSKNKHSIQMVCCNSGPGYIACEDNQCVYIRSASIKKTGKVYIFGNEPFTYLGLRVEGEQTYCLFGNLNEELRDNYQNKVLTIEGRIVEGFCPSGNNDGIIIKVTSYSIPE